jgi:putative transcription antitermination factor YqgF|tara:strand:+ start:644 stop:1024 length:381 start_codon:yes stop_codon:yes gene_type:complete
LSNLLGIDFGERFVGIAIKKSNVSIPYAHKIIDTKNTELISEIKETVEKEGISKIIIGYPIGLNKNQSRMSKLVDNFIENNLKVNFDLPIKKVDERLTSKIIDNVTDKRYDDLSAVKLLETYCSNE